MRQALLSLLLSSVSLAACHELPGEVVGTYSVTMKLEENECGANAIYELDGKRYAVELRKDEDEVFWRIAGQTPIPGTYEPPDYQFAYASVVAKDAPDSGALPCRLVQNEKLTAQVQQADLDAGVSGNDEDAGDGGHALTGEHELTISAESGSDCKRALSPEGAFAKLPCTLRYSLTGSPRKPL